MLHNPTERAGRGQQQCSASRLGFLAGEPGGPGAFERVAECVCGRRPAASHQSALSARPRRQRARPIWFRPWSRRHRALPRPDRDQPRRGPVDLLLARGGDEERKSAARAGGPAGRRRPATPVGPGRSRRSSVSSIAAWPAAAAGLHGHDRAGRVGRPAGRLTSRLASGLVVGLLPPVAGQPAGLPARPPAEHRQLPVGGTRLAGRATCPAVPGSWKGPWAGWRPWPPARAA